MENEGFLQASNTQNGHSWSYKLPKPQIFQIIISNIYFE